MIAALSAALSANPGLVAALALLGLGSLDLAFMGLVMWRSGVSPRPIIFVAGLYLLVTLPFLAGQLVLARAPALPPPAGGGVWDPGFVRRPREIVRAGRDCSRCHGRAAGHS